MGTNSAPGNAWRDGQPLIKIAEPGQPKDPKHHWTTGRIFPAARSEGACARCHLPIEEGQLIREHYDLGWIHARHQHKQEQPTEPCQRCWLIHQGECDRA